MIEFSPNKYAFTGGINERYLPDGTNVVYWGEVLLADIGLIVIGDNGSVLRSEVFDLSDLGSVLSIGKNPDNTILLSASMYDKRISQECLQSCKQGEIKYESYNERIWIAKLDLNSKIVPEQKTVANLDFGTIFITILTIMSYSFKKKQKITK